VSSSTKIRKINNACLFGQNQEDDNDDDGSNTKQKSNNIYS
jgi:hypothetical protein